MRNSERLAAVKRVVEGDRIIINQSTTLGGVINRIEKWPEIHQALAVLVGYQEDGEDIPGLIQPNNHSNYVADLIAQYPSHTTEFHGELFNSLQGELDGFCENLPIVMHTLEQMSPEPSGSSLTAQFNGILSIDEFQRENCETLRDGNRLRYWSFRWLIPFSEPPTMPCPRLIQAPAKRRGLFVCSRAGQLLEIRHESGHVEVSNHGSGITDYSHPHIFALSVGLLDESKYIACIMVAEPDPFKAVAPFVSTVGDSLFRFLVCKPDIQRSFAKGDPRTSAVKGEVGRFIET